MREPEFCESSLELSIANSEIGRPLKKQFAEESGVEPRLAGPTTRWSNLKICAFEFFARARPRISHLRAIQEDLAGRIEHFTPLSLEELPALRGTSHARKAGLTSAERALLEKLRGATKILLDDARARDGPRKSSPLGWVRRLCEARANWPS